MTLPIVYRSFFKETEDMPEEFWGNEGAGALIVAKDTGRILLLLRSDDVMQPNTWNLGGGKIDAGEDPKEAVAREVEEETGLQEDFKPYLLYTFKHRDFKYYNFLVIIPNEFTPQLNWEHNNSKWVDFGDWPSPLHFGLNDLLKHAGNKIKEVTDAIKARIEKNKLFEAMDAPPIVHQTNAFDFSTNFTKYIKKVENAGKVGYKDRKWYPHESPEGGLPTIAYGHKIKPEELEKLQNGISDAEAEDLLKQDLGKAYTIVVKYNNLWKEKYVKQAHDFAESNTNHPYAKFYANVKTTDPLFKLDGNQTEILVDYAFNLGSLKGFPKFADAVFRHDWDVAKKEYKRSYKDAQGTRHELGRNKEFYDQFLSKTTENTQSSTEVDLIIEGMDSEKAEDIFNSFGIPNAGDLSPEDLKKAHIELVKKHHPDVGGSNEDMRFINAAYDVLKLSGRSSRPHYRNTPEEDDEPIHRTYPHVYPDDEYAPWAQAGWSGGLRNSSHIHREDFRDLNYCKKKAWEISGKPAPTRENEYTIWNWDGYYFRGVFSVFAVPEKLYEISKMMQIWDDGGSVAVFFTHKSEPDNVVYLVNLKGLEVKPPKKYEHESFNRNPGNDNNFVKKLRNEI